MKKLLFLLVIFISCVALFYKPAKTPASLDVLECEASSCSIETKEQVAFVKELILEPLFYLGKGKQCQAFQTKDSKFVVKLLLQKPLRIAKRKEALLSSFLLAYTKVSEETGTVVVHLNATQNLYETALFIDRYGNPCHVPLDTTQFIVQKKAKLLKLVLSELMWEGKLDEAKHRIDQVFRLLFDCAKKGVCDMDQALIRNNNIGLLEDRAIYIDIGKLRDKPEMKEKSEFIKDLTRLRALHSWLALYYPDLADYFMEAKVRAIEAF